MSVSRPIQIAGNWKMNLDRATVEDYCARLAAADLPPEIEVLLFPPHTLVAVVSAALAQSPVSWGGQDLHPASAGAHTGDVSAAHLLDWGADQRRAGSSAEVAVGDHSTPANRVHRNPIHHTAKPTTAPVNNLQSERRQ